MEQVEEVKGIAEYSVTVAALADLKTNLTGKVYDMTNALDAAKARFDRRGLVTLRTDLEKKRKELKAPALEHCRLIDDEAKRITIELKTLEDPIDAQIKADEDRREEIRLEKARVEAERVAAIVAQIDAIRNIPMSPEVLSKDAFSLEIFIAAVESRQIGDGFGDMIDQAQAAKDSVVASLKASLEVMKEKEAEAARIKAEQEAESERLEALRLENEKTAALERERLEVEKLERDRVHALEQEKIDLERAELAVLRADQEKREAALQAERDEQAKAIAKEKADKESEAARVEAAAQKVRDEEAAALAESNRKAAEASEKAAKEAEKARKLAEREKKLADARCADAKDALKKILAITQDKETSNPAEALEQIALIAEASI